MLEGVAMRRQLRKDPFVSCLLETRLGDGQHIPLVFEYVLAYCERLVSDRSCIDQCHMGGTLLTIVGNGLYSPLGLTMCRFQSYNVHVVDAALVVSGYKAGSTSNYWTNCTLTIATGSAPSCDCTNSIVLYRVEQRLRRLAASDTSNVRVEQFLPSVGHHVMWVQV